ncbi:hypothetical protein ANN_12216 [Periplaneta americana]|uniref:Uncharacterized protein n=1 Tax=Periplaneta americana TaxID=6978 RepID=A0ABQ8THB1_PERAM|nr:hypothetical protein ANN_12216 [Periplaneta americana]
MGDSRNAYRVLVGRPKGKGPLGRPRRRWDDNIKMDLREVGYDGREWINLAQDRDRWQAYVRAEMNLRVPCKPFVIRINGPRPDLILGSNNRHANREIKENDTDDDDDDDDYDYDDDDDIDVIIMIIKMMTTTLMLKMMMMMIMMMIIVHSINQSSLALAEMCKGYCPFAYVASLFPPPASAHPSVKAGLS